MNNLKRKSNLIVALLAFEHVLIGVVTVVSNNIKALEMYKEEPYDPMYGHMQDRLPSIIISSLITYLPVMLFAIYAMFLYKKKKNHPLLMGSFAFAIALKLWSIVGMVSSVLAMSQYIGFSNSPYTRDDMIQQYLPQMIAYAVMMLIYVFFLVDASKNFKFVNISKILSLIMAVALCVVPVFSLIITDRFTERTVSATVNAAVEKVAATDMVTPFLIQMLLALALIVFWWVAVPNDSTKLSKSDLENLRKKYESGKIDEQTYQKKRAEILEKI